VVLYFTSKVIIVSVFNYGCISRDPQIQETGYFPLDRPILYTSELLGADYEFTSVSNWACPMSFVKMPFFDDNPCLYRNQQRSLLGLISDKDLKVSRLI
jgi:hypothetical protein